jgi:hypothetical protein
MSSINSSYDEPTAVYAKLNQQQRTMLALEFIRGFQRSGVAGAEPFTRVDLKKVSLKQLADMHMYARAEQPEVLGRVMRHPIVAALLGGFGAYEIEKHVARRYTS